MKKVLIISYFFPPCNLTASQRVFSWAKYLNKFGYRPVVLTRRWDNKINSLADISKETPSEILLESNENYDVYFLPYQPNLRDKIYVKFGEHKYSGIRRLLTFFELLFQNFFTAIIPYCNLFSYAEELIKKDNSISKVIISGNPYNTFKIGFSLNKKFRVKWIADYRDAWTSSEIRLAHSPFIFKVINQFDAYFEKKWVSTASYITASSSPIAHSISHLCGVKSEALYNGFVQEDFDGISNGKYDTFTITYVGTLYAGQKVEIFCTALKKLIDTTRDIRIKLYFPGLSFYKEQAQRIVEVMKGYEKYYECTLRVERSKILEIEKRSHLLFHVAWDENPGIIASKIYEYIASGTFILVAPSDHGSIQEIIELSKCGRCTNTVDETFDFLKTEYDNFLKGSYRKNDTSCKEVQQFSRENQTKQLAEILDRI